jgi:transposase
MPWSEKSIVSQRGEFVMLFGQEGVNRRELCRRFGISPTIGYRLLARYRQEGKAGLADRSRRPRRSPARIPEGMEGMVLAVRHEHPAWGGRKIRRRLQDLGHPGVASSSTITAVLHRNDRIDRGLEPPAYGPRPRQPSMVAAFEPDKREQARQAAFQWMRAVLQKEIGPDALRRVIGDVPDIAALLDRLYGGRLSDRNRSMVVLASRGGLSCGMVCGFLGIDKKTYRKYLLTFKNGGHAALFARQKKSTRKFDNESVKQAVFKLLHEPPSNHGINRATWIMPDLSQVLRDTGQPACPDVIRKITKAAGYRWRRARKVLTSTDPEYREKVHHIQSILAELEENEAFFSIDEFGPFAIRAQGGRTLAGPGELPTVPQYQKSKGSFIITAALELSQNQITYFYSPRKDTGEMLRMLATLIEEYTKKRRVYLSWDAASWHLSKMLYAHVAEHNDAVAKGEVVGPLVGTATRWRAVPQRDRERVQWDGACDHREQ